MKPPTDAKEMINQLVDKFAKREEDLKSPHYNEANVRNEFIDPFFAALGWDMRNEGQNAEQYKDVVSEAITSDGKKADYSFRIGGIPKFFVEAKKPFVDIKSKAENAIQIRRYIFSAKHRLGILTDFEELAVYTCSKDPKEDDDVATDRLFYCRYDEYNQPIPKEYKIKDYRTNWDFISSIFSKDGILKGNFDKFAEKGSKAPTLAVDEKFLQDIERWREALAKHIKNQNHHINERGLNYAVQAIIDRIIFLRIAEDRGLEKDKQLRGLLKGKGNNIYSGLKKLFTDADDRYNSGLFYFNAEKDRGSEIDTITPNLKIENEVLRNIIKGLYYPAPYVFSIIPIEIIGSIYERFLGKTIVVTDKRARVEEKPAVKKAGGVFYTPSYIVSYIIKENCGETV